MVYVLAARAAVRRELQYRWAHMVNNLGSAVFGFVYIAAWRAVLGRQSLSGVDAAFMTRYMVVSQVFLWLTTFMTFGLGIPEGMRTGSVAADLARPVDFFGLYAAREAGALAYGLLYRCLPMAVLFALTVGFPLPGSWPLGLAGVALGAYVGLCLNYLAGLAAFWTVQARWAWGLRQTLTLVLGGIAVPPAVYPGWLQGVVAWSPFRACGAIPTLIWLGRAGAGDLAAAAGWAAALTLLARALTGAARRRVEVQGG